MTTKFSFKKSALAAALAMGVSGAAMAEVSGSFDISSMYLWRGIDLGDPNVSGAVDYAHESGGYAGLWLSSQNEYDWYFGFANELEGFSYDIGYVDYNFPEDMMIDAQEAYIILGTSMEEFDLEIGGFFGVGDYGHGDGAVSNDDDYAYIAVGSGDIGVTLGQYMWDQEDTDFTHLDVSYSVNDNLTLTASKIISSDDCALGGNNLVVDPTDPSGLAMVCDSAADESLVPDDLQFNLSYSVPFE